MPADVKAHIVRLEQLRDNLANLSDKIYRLNGQKVSAEQIEVVNMWGNLKDKLQDLIFLNDSIDHSTEGLKTGDVPESMRDIVRQRLERDLEALPSRLRSLLTLEKKAINVFENYKNITKQDLEKEADAKNIEEPKAVTKEIKAEKVVSKQVENAKVKAKKIEVAKEKAVESINARTGDMGRISGDIFIKQIENTFDIKGGQIEQGKDFIKQLNKLTVEVLDLLQQEPKFTGPVSTFIKRLYPISDAITEFQKDVNGIKVPALTVEKKIVIDETIDKMLDNGLNQKFVQPLRDLVYRNVTGGLSLSEAKAAIKEYIQGGNDVSGKLGSYLEQTAIQSVDMYSGIINKKLMEEFKYDGLLMTGSLIDNSSPQCRYAIEVLKGKITKENWADVVAHVGKSAPLIEGTTFDNVALNKLHWGCRHNFFPIIIKKAS